MASLQPPTIALRPVTWQSLFLSLWPSPTPQQETPKIYLNPTHTSYLNRNTMHS